MLAPATTTTATSPPLVAATTADEPARATAEEAPAPDRRRPLPRLEELAEELPREPSLSRMRRALRFAARFIPRPSRPSFSVRNIFLSGFALTLGAFIAVPEFRSPIMARMVDAATGDTGAAMATAAILYKDPALTGDARITARNTQVYAVETALTTEGLDFVYGKKREEQYQIEVPLSGVLSYTSPIGLFGPAMFGGGWLQAGANKIVNDALSTVRLWNQRPTTPANITTGGIVPYDDPLRMESLIEEDLSGEVRNLIASLVGKEARTQIFKDKASAAEYVELVQMLAQQGLVVLFEESQALENVIDMNRFGQVDRAYRFGSFGPGESNAADFFRMAGLELTPQQSNETAVATRDAPSTLGFPGLIHSPALSTLSSAQLRSVADKVAKITKRLQAAHEHQLALLEESHADALAVYSAEIAELQQELAKARAAHREPKNSTIAKAEQAVADAVVVTGSSLDSSQFIGEFVITTSLRAVIASSGTAAMVTASATGPFGVVFAAATVLHEWRAWDVYIQAIQATGTPTRLATTAQAYERVVPRMVRDAMQTQLRHVSNALVRVAREAREGRYQDAARAGGELGLHSVTLAFGGVAVTPTLTVIHWVLHLLGLPVE